MQRSVGLDHRKLLNARFSCGKASMFFMHPGLRQKLLHKWLILLVPQNLCHRSSLMGQILSLSCCRLWQLQEPAVAAEAIAATAAKDSYHGLAILTDSQGAAVPRPPAWPLHSLQGWLPRQHWLPSTACEAHFSLACSAKAVKAVQQCVLGWHLLSIDSAKTFLQTPYVAQQVLSERSPTKSHRKL